MRRSPVIFLGLALILGLVVAGVLLYRDRNSPGYALRRLAYNITTENYKEIYNYLDMAAIIQGLIQEAGQDLAAGLSQKKKTPMDRWAFLLGGKLAGQLLTRMLEGADKPARRLLEDYLRSLSPGERQALEEAVRHPEVAVSRNGDEARVVLRFEPGGERLHLTMRRSPEDRRWRVSGVTYHDLMRIMGIDAR